MRMRMRIKGCCLFVFLQCHQCQRRIQETALTITTYIKTTLISTKQIKIQFTSLHDPQSLTLIIPSRSSLNLIKCDSNQTTYLYRS
ncbi:hypothetical protein DFH28DRAFT_945130 [Melampsora americana]|nr:hypothetical protein DFH28DRAFT_945130 [Melampsora americana]